MLRLARTLAFAALVAGCSRGRDAGHDGVPGLDPHKRRIGLTVTADGTLYDAYFIKSPEQRLALHRRHDRRGAADQGRRSGEHVRGGFSSVRGVAYDAKQRRLFASDHASGGQASGVRVLPVD